MGIRDDYFGSEKAKKGPDPLHWLELAYYKKEVWEKWIAQSFYE
jgi:hypothetical protein